MPYRVKTASIIVKRLCQNISSNNSSKNMDKRIVKRIINRIVRKIIKKSTKNNQNNHQDSHQNSQHENCLNNLQNNCQKMNKTIIKSVDYGHPMKAYTYQRYLKNWADSSDKICFSCTLKFESGSEFFGRPLKAISFLGFRSP